MLNNPGAVEFGGCVLLYSRMLDYVNVEVMCDEKQYLIIL